mgnify:CR=1 FL=1
MFNYIIDDITDYISHDIIDDIADVEMRWKLMFKNQKTSRIHQLKFNYNLRTRHALLMTSNITSLMTCYIS